MTPNFKNGDYEVKLEGTEYFMRCVISLHIRQTILQKEVD